VARRREWGAGGALPGSRAREKAWWWWSRGKCKRMREMKARKWGWILLYDDERERERQGKMVGLLIVACVREKRERR